MNDNRIIICYYVIMIIINLKELRKEKGLTQEELADGVGVSRQTIISIEKEVYQPSLELAFKLARFLNVSLETLCIYEKK